MNDNVFTAMSKAQANMGKLVKGSVNPHFRSSYANLSDVMHAVIPPCTDQGLSIWHSMPDAHTMRTTLSHGVSDTHVNCDVPLIVDKQNMQGMKSATTYAKRIGVESVCGIAADDDDGNAASAAPPKQKAKPKMVPQPVISTERVLELIRQAKEIGWQEEEMFDLLKEKIGVKSTKELDESKFATFKDLLMNGEKSE